jgi:DNA-binding transcriptional LysR family regulator
MDLFAAMRTFVDVADQGSFARVAQHRHLSPAMVGNHIRFLESRLGAALINRTTRRHSLTDVGHAYLLRCRRILDDVRAADEAIASGIDVPTGELRVTAPFSVGTTLLPGVVAEYLHTYPRVKIELVLSDHRLNLVEGGFDAAIRAGELTDSAMVCRALAPLRLVVCASPGYLASRGMPETVQDLADHACLGFTPPAGGRTWRFFNAGGLSEVAVQGPLLVNSGHALRTAALENLGIIMQPEALVAADLEAGRLLRLLPNEKAPSRPLHLLMLPSRFANPKLRLFSDLMVARLGMHASQSADQAQGSPLARPATTPNSLSPE